MACLAAQAGADTRRAGEADRGVALGRDGGAPFPGHDDGHAAAATIRELGGAAIVVTTALTNGGGAGSRVGEGGRYVRVREVVVRDPGYGRRACGRGYECRGSGTRADGTVGRGRNV